MITPAIILLTIFTLVQSSPWTWTCENGKCIKTRLPPGEKQISPALCELTCGTYSRIWPMPTKIFEITREFVPIDLEDGYTGSGTHSVQLKAIVDRFFTITSIYNDHNKNTAQLPDKTRIHFNISDLESSKLYFNTDESYSLHIIPNNNNCVEITIKSVNVFGARHALETLSQLLVYHESDQVYVVPKQVIIEDKPVYSYRGLMLDTGHNYVSVAKIKSVIEGMAVNKLNTLHWHITDSSSFPFVSKSLPSLSDLGAYSDKQVYSVEDIQGVVNWGLVRGVRVIPEFDGPAHVGEGWQDSGLVVCFNKQPWDWYCKEPPCGQFDPTKDELYTTLNLLYKDFIDVFDPIAFHFGGDEVNFNCWRSESSITTWMSLHNLSTVLDSGYLQLWSYYQNKTYEIFMENLPETIPAILWTSKLTDLENLHMVPPDKYIIHVWTNGTDETIANLLSKDYKMIFSYYDSLYLDCGLHSWVSDGYNWCAPYNTWKKIYETSPAEIIAAFGAELNKPQLILGAEAALWTETSDDPSVENRIWPRTAALAERVWAEPTSSWAAAEYRLDSHRQRMLKLGIHADTLVPQWCYLNQDSCRR